MQVTMARPSRGGPGTRTPPRRTARWTSCSMAVIGGEGIARQAGCTPPGRRLPCQERKLQGCHYPQPIHSLWTSAEGQLSDSFVHLHLHTEFSMLDGAARIGDVMAAAAADGQPAIGITDHGNMYGVLDFYNAAKKAGIRPIIGMEGYFVTGSRHDRPRRAEHEIFHLTLLSETTKGYQNLIKVSSAAYLD